jgi:integrase
MTSLDTAPTVLTAQEPPGPSFDEEQLAAASFLARYNGRTLEAYRHDLRGFFQWAHDHDIQVMLAKRPHIELFRVSMEQRGLAAATIDRRLSTVCGFYKFAHIDGIISSNPAQYVRRPQVHPTDARGLDRSEFGVFLFAAERFDRDHAALAVLLGLNGLRVTEACETNVEDLGFERGHRTLKSSGRATNPPPSHSSLERHAPSTSPLANGAKAGSCDDATANASTDAPHTAGSKQSASEPDWATSTRTAVLCVHHGRSRRRGPSA